MRALLVIVALAGVAHADARRVVVFGESDSAAALQIALGGDALVMAEGQPSGGLRLERAAAVQRVALEDGADAGVWVEEDAASTEVCVVSADGKYFRHAPLPADVEPRVFAAIATSLLDELLAPPEASNIHVDVHVDVTPGPAGPMVAVTPPPAMVVAPYPPVDRGVAPPSLVAGPSLVMPHQPRPARWDRTLLEVGPMLTPVSAGLDAELAFPLAPSLQFGVIGIANRALDSDFGMLYAAGGELRHVSEGAGARHFDVGVVGGAATADGDSVGFAGARLGMTWEGDSSGMEISVVPVLVFTGDTADPIAPGAWVALRWKVPL